MKNLTISNFKSMDGYEVGEWELYSPTETEQNYAVKVRRKDGHINHGCIQIKKEFCEDGYITIHLMYQTFRNCIGSGKYAINEFKDKDNLLRNLVLAIEREHEKHI
jgi:hypothetical protein